MFRCLPMGWVVVWVVVRAGGRGEEGEDYYAAMVDGGLV